MSQIGLFKPTFNYTPFRLFCQVQYIILKPPLFCGVFYKIILRFKEKWSGGVKQDPSCEGSKRKVHLT